MAYPETIYKKYVDENKWFKVPLMEEMELWRERGYFNDIDTAIVSLNDDNYLRTPLAEYKLRLD